MDDRLDGFILLGGVGAGAMRSCMVGKATQGRMAGVGAGVGVAFGTAALSASLWRCLLRGWGVRRVGVHEGGRRLIMHCL